MSPSMPVGIAVFVVVASMAACGSSSSPSSSPTPTGSPTPVASGTTTITTHAGCVNTNSVIIDSYAFNPNCIQITANQNVLFKNNDSVTHTATSDTGAAVSFDSGNLATGATFEQSFRTTPAGGATITGTCTIHSFMTFKVIVTD